MVSARAHGSWKKAKKYNRLAEYLANSLDPDKTGAVVCNAWSEKADRLRAPNVLAMMFIAQK